jgi:hypothetical protein
MFPTVAEGRDEGVIVAWVMPIVNVPVAEVEVVGSVTVTLKGYEPIVVGVPVINPLELKLRPGGSGAVLSCHVTAPEVPAAVNCWE